jgi:hypothetical protein
MDSTAGSEDLCGTSAGNATPRTAAGVATGGCADPDAGVTPGAIPAVGPVSGPNSFCNA